MQSNRAAVFAAFVTTCVVNLLGVYFIFQPVSERGGPSLLSIPPIVGFLAYIVLCVALFHWAAQQLRNAWKAAFMIAASQFILVNVDYVLTGKRGLMTAAASTLVLAATWYCTAFVYNRFVSWNND